MDQSEKSIHKRCAVGSGAIRPHPLLLPVVVMTLFFAFVSWSPPLFYTALAEWHESWQRQLLSRVCHQQLGRTFHIDGIPLAACSRCIGIYTALPLTMVPLSFFIDVVVRAKPYITRIFVLASLLMVVDGAANLLQVWQTSDSVRMLTGAFWGVSTGLLLLFALTFHRNS